MSGVADEIAAFLMTANGGALNLTTAPPNANLFTKYFPTAAPPAAVAIVPFPGKQSDRNFGGSLAEYPRFHVFVRGADQSADAATKALADQIYKLLDNLGPATLSGVVYRDVDSMYGPPVPLDDEINTQRPIYAMAFECDKDQS